MLKVFYPKRIKIRIFYNNQITKIQKRTMNKLLIILLASSVIHLSCTKSEKPEPTENNTTQSDVATDTAATSIYTVNGVVASLPPGGKFIIIDHEEIAGLMNAMQMPFYLENPGVAEGIQPEDSIKFTFKTNNGKMIVTNIEKLE